jgi:hypothetical protein
MRCRHCRRRPMTRPRRLCWSCFYSPEIRDRYGPASKFGRRGEGNFNRDVPLADQPTEAPPGSAEKIEVMAERVKLRVAVFHPDDAPLPLPAPEIRKAA